MSAPTKPRKTRSPKAAPSPEPDVEALRAELDAAAPVGEDGSIQPVQIGKRGRAGQEMVTIFTLDGEDYSIPKNPNPALTLRFMRQARDPKIGAATATGNLMLSLLGQEALDALADSPETSEEDVADVFAIVTRVAFDSITRISQKDGPAGNS